MKVPKDSIAHDYRTLVVILATLLLSLPASAAWKNLAPMPSGRYQAAVETINGIVYVAGGYNAGGTSTLQAFNSETNTWTALASTPLTLYGEDGAGVINSQLYVAGAGTVRCLLARCSCTIRLAGSPWPFWRRSCLRPRIFGGRL
jgi:hypothetical protein